jgi:hypothetical protein
MKGNNMEKTTSARIYDLLHSFQYESERTTTQHEYVRVKNECSDKINTEISNLIDQFVQECEEKSFGKKIPDIFDENGKLLYGRTNPQAKVPILVNIDDIHQIADELKSKLK